MKHVFTFPTSSRNKISWIEMTVEFIPLSLAFIYLNIIIWFKMGKPFYCYLYQGITWFLQDQNKPVGVRKVWRSLEIVLTFRFIEFNKCIELIHLLVQRWFKDVQRSPRPTQGIHEVLLYPTTYLCEGVFFLHMLHINNTLKQIEYRYRYEKPGHSHSFKIFYS